MDTKISGGFLKSADEHAGTVECVFATLNVVDSDGDVTVPGAFTEGQAVAISQYGHSVWEKGFPPVGRGTIHVVGAEAIMRGQFFMDMPEARSAFLSVKGMGEIQQWSYGFTTDLAEFGEFQGQGVKFLRSVTVFEVSPVLRAAGVGTGTRSAKGHSGRPGGPAAGRAVPLHVKTVEELGAAGIAEMRAAQGHLAMLDFQEREEWAQEHARMIGEQVREQSAADDAAYLRTAAEIWHHA